MSDLDCNNCKESANISGILNGEFGDWCNNCWTNTRIQRGAHASYLRDQDREHNLADMVQPYDHDGTPNKAFIELYPEQARKTFTAEELDHYS